jgi:hypothetical protein
LFSESQNGEKYELGKISSFLYTKINKSTKFGTSLDYEHDKKCITQKVGLEHQFDSKLKGKAKV